LRPWREGPIEIRNTTLAALCAILEYIYTDELHFADEDVIDVMRKAGAYTRPLLSST